MPILNVSAFFGRPASELQILLNQLQLVSCQDVITLAATLVGAPEGHSFKWVQLSGAPVEWLEDQDQLSTTFRQPVIRDDKKFRFYLDYGTPRQKYKDILVSLVAQEPLPPFENAFAKNNEGSGRISSSNFVSMPAPGIAGKALVSNPERMLVWPMVNQSSTSFLRTYRQGPPRQFLNELPKSQTYMRGVSIGDEYTVDYVFSVKGTSIVETSPIMAAELPSSDDISTWEDSKIQFGSASLLTKTVITRSISEALVTDTLSARFDSNVQQTKAVITRSKIETSADEIFTMQPSMNSRQVVTFSLTNHTSIG